MAYNLRTGLMGSGNIDTNVTLSDLIAANITSKFSHSHFNLRP